MTPDWTMSSGNSKTYEDDTTPYRGDKTKPCKVVKSLGEAAGIATFAFIAHSLRGADSSVAVNLGITNIIKTLDWNSKLVLYIDYKPTQAPTFGRVGLSMRDTR